MVAQDYDMKINVKKTKVMTISMSPRSKLVILVNDVKLKQVNEF